MAAITAVDAIQLLAAAIEEANAGPRVFPLEYVAERTGFSITFLTRGCQSERITHTRQGKFRGLTAEQIDILVRRHAVEGGIGPIPGAADDLEEVRIATLRSGARRGRRVAST